MEKSILVLSLLASSSLIASREIPQVCYQPDHCEESCDCDCSSDDCSSCYIPSSMQCTPCIYPPQFYDLECDCGFIVSGDFLYWYGRETNLVYTIKQTMRSSLPEPSAGVPNPNVNGFPTSYENLGVKWKPGFRVSFGWNHQHNGFDTLFQWTNYQNEKTTSTNAIFTGNFPLEGETALVGLYINDNYLGTPFYTLAKARWKFRFNQLDFEFGGKYWLGHCFAMRPYGGVRFGWIKTELDINYLLGPTTDPNNTSRVDIVQNNESDTKNKYWGIGLLAGFQPNWYFCPGFLLFANLDGALIWGKFTGTETQKYFGASVINNIATTEFENSNKAKETLRRMQGIIDLGLGLRWECNWCCNRFRTSLDAGWEHHIWINSGLRHRVLGRTVINQNSTSLTYFSDSTDIVSDLAFGGLVIRLRLDF